MRANIDASTLKEIRFFSQVLPNGVRSFLRFQSYDENAIILHRDRFTG